MTDQLDLFDHAAAVAARDEGMAAVEVRSPHWRAVAFDALVSVARTRLSVTSDDVWRELDEWGIPRPTEGRAMGPVMLRAVKEGVLTPAGFSHGEQPGHHHDIARTYRSLVNR